MQKRLLAGLVLALTVQIMSGSAAAQGVRGINELIQELEPASPEVQSTPAYRKKLRRVQIPVPGIGDGPIQNRYIMLDYNRSVDLEIYFAFDSASIAGSAAAQLDYLGRALTSPGLENAVYLLAGHTDSKGKADYNQALSQRRAISAKNYLIENFPIAADRLIAVGFGESELRDPRHPTSAINRRVEVTLVDMGAPVSNVEPRVDGVPLTGNVVCDTAENVLTDERPAAQDIDDFGGQRTKVDCAAQHDQLEPGTAAGGGASNVDSMIVE